MNIIITGMSKQLTLTAIITICLIINTFAESQSQTILWDISSGGYFEPTNKLYQIENGRVLVDLADDTIQCPTGLGHLASGREHVKAIDISFVVELTQDYWLYILWDGGGSGTEQFEVFADGLSVGKSVSIIANNQPYQPVKDTFKLKLSEGKNIITLKHLSGDGLNFRSILLSNKELSELPLPLNPKLKFPTAESYEKQIREPAVLLDSPYVMLFAPKSKETQAKIIFDYLVRAYDELYTIVGLHTEYKIVIYHFPPKDEHGWGGTSNCTIWYSYDNLNFESHKEWTQHKVPHLVGYIEEMAHNFDGHAGAQFGWEMVGWNLGVTVTKKIANNPILRKNLADTRATQKKTFQQYLKNGHVFPSDIPPNLCDRIHAYILWVCEKKYRGNFWKDFFEEIRKEQAALQQAGTISDPDERRNRRYQITIDCFDRLKGIEFKKILKRYHISLTTAVKSLHPTDSNWNRRFLSVSEQ